MKENQIKCQGHIDRGATCVRGYHDCVPCPHKAKYKITHEYSGNSEYLCGIHKNAMVKKGYDITIEKL